MKKIGEPVSLQREFLGFSVRYIASRKIHPFTIWQADECVAFTSSITNAMSIMREVISGRWYSEIFDTELA